jgi:hypothetical protein
VEHERWGTPVASYVAGLPPDARPLDRGKPRDEDTEGGSQPADKSLINRRLSLHSQPCAAMAFLADGELAEQALNHASPLDREHKRLAPRSGYDSRAWRRGTKQIPVNRQIVSRHAARGEPLFKAFSDHRT